MFLFAEHFYSHVIEIISDTTLAEAVKLPASHKILSTPVVDVKAPEDTNWMDIYIGIVEFVEIVVWILHKVEGHSEFEFDLAMNGHDKGPVVITAANGISSPRHPSMHPNSPIATCGKFFETLTSSDLYKNTKVVDISGCFRWAPFLALQKSISLLTLIDRLE